MKYLFRTSLGLLLLSIGFLGNIDVNAKSVDISKTPIINYHYSGLVYGTATSINEYGTVIYDSSLLGGNFQEAVNEAAQSWNDAIGRKVFVEKNSANALDDQVDLFLLSTDRNSKADMGYSGVGWGNSASKIFLNNTALNDSLSGKGSSGYVQLISTIRHEMGHTLGLKHDNGLVMADLYDAQINNNQDMLAAAQKSVNLISNGTLPTIPLFNKYAVLNILNNRDKIYYLNNNRSNQIASIFLDSPTGKISGVKFVDFNIEIKGNYNLYKLSLSPKDPYVGTTFSNNILNKTVSVSEVLVSVYDQSYYLFEADGEEYIVNSQAFL